jgi:hypothetical protein
MRFLGLVLTGALALTAPTALRLVVVPCRARGVRRQRECHLYFARRVSFLSCADIARSSEALAIGPPSGRCLRSETAIQQRCARKRGPANENVRSLRASLTSVLGAFDQPEKR